MTLGQRLKAAREAAGLTQTEVSRVTGVGQMTISRWERDAAEPQARALYKVAKAIGASVDDLLSEDDVEPAAAAA